jgi:hypothetical protein
MNPTPRVQLGHSSAVTIESDFSDAECGVRVFSYLDLNLRSQSCADSLRKILLSDESGFLISGFPSDDNESLLLLNSALGSAFPAGYELLAHPMENDVVYRIESRADGEGIRRNDFLVTSTTSQAFACHTDGFCSVSPADIVCTLCVRPAPGEGITMLIRLKQILAQLSEREIDLLRQPAFPAKQGLVPILYDHEGELCIRFNKLDIDHFSAATQYDLPREYQDVAERLEDLCSFANVPYRFLMKPGDCLVINNRTLLHGRTSFSSQSNRLMKRLWVMSPTHSDH